MLELVKTALRITTDAYDDELEILIADAIQDLTIANVVVSEDPDEIIQGAIVCYCKAFFGAGDETMRKVYDDKKAKLQMASGYTDWGVL